MKVASPWLAALLLVSAYGILSLGVWFALLPAAVPGPVPLLSSVAGPPAMLLWREEGLAAFVVASVVLLFLVGAALRARRHRKLWISAAGVVWVISGFLSYAVSI